MLLCSPFYSAPMPHLKHTRYNRRDDPQLFCPQVPRKCCANTTLIQTIPNQINFELLNTSSTHRLKSDIHTFVKRFECMEPFILQQRTRYTVHFSQVKQPSPLNPLVLKTKNIWSSRVPHTRYKALLNHFLCVSSIPYTAHHCQHHIQPGILDPQNTFLDQP